MTVADDMVDADRLDVYALLVDAGFPDSAAWGLSGTRETVFIVPVETT